MANELEPLPAPQAPAFDRVALVIWILGALMMAALLMKDLIVALLR